MRREGMRREARGDAARGVRVARRDVALQRLWGAGCERREARGDEARGDEARGDEVRGVRVARRKAGAWEGVKVRVGEGCRFVGLSRMSHCARTLMFVMPGVLLSRAEAWYHSLPGESHTDNLFSIQGIALQDRTCKRHVERGAIMNWQDI